MHLGSIAPIKGGVKVIKRSKPILIGLALIVTFVSALLFAALRERVIEERWLDINSGKIKVIRCKKYFFDESELVKSPIEDILKKYNVNSIEPEKWERVSFVRGNVFKTGPVEYDIGKDYGEALARAAATKNTVDRSELISAIRSGNKQYILLNPITE